MLKDSRRMLITLRCDKCSADLDNPTDHFIVNARTGVALCGGCFLPTPAAAKLLADSAQKNAYGLASKLRKKLGIDAPASRMGMP